jgi:hypothetical protein
VCVARSTIVTVVIAEPLGIRHACSAACAALFGHLLELNASLCGVAFASDGDHVLLVSERSTLDLDLSEVRDAIERVTTYADEHDDVLVARFGGQVGAVSGAAAGAT